MKKKLIIAAVLLGLCLVLAGVYWFVTRDRQAVINLVDELAQTLHLKSGRLPHDGALKHNKVGEFFAENVSFRMVDPELSINVTNESLVQYAAMFFRNTGSLEVKPHDISADVAGDGAIFSCDAEIYFTANGGGQEISGVYHVSGSAEKNDGKWKISSIVVEPIVK